MHTKFSIPFFLSLAFIFLTCKKENLSCSRNSEFCAYIDVEDYYNTIPLINNFIEEWGRNSSDETNLEHLIEWLKCKSCVKHAEILCNTCIYTLPPQSEIKVIFNIKGQQKEKVLDILMSKPIVSRGYHD